MRSRPTATPPGPASGQGNTLANLILASAQAHPDAHALVTPQVRWTYKLLCERAITTAGALRTAGVRRGDRIGIYMEDSPLYLELVVACVLLGAVPVLFNVADDPDHLRLMLRSLDLKIVFGSRCAAHDLAAPLARMLADPQQDASPLLIEVDLDAGAAASPFVRLLGGCEAFTHDELRAQAQTSAPTDPLVILFTSAASSEIAKTCLLTHQDIVDNMGPLTQRIRLTADSRLWIPLHMFQVGFFSPWATALAMGATTIAADRFEATTALRLLVAERVTHAYPVYPSYLLPIVYHTDFFASDFPALTHVILLGPMSVLRRVQRAVPQAAVMNNYGSAELGGTMCLPLDDDPADIRLGSIGYPYPCHALRIADPSSGVPCAPGEIGEIQIRHQPPSLQLPGNVSLFTPDGWLRTSDLALQAANGAVYFQGRLSEMLTIAGKTISANVIEAVLCEHPAVSVAQVIGLADPALGQAPHAFVELRPGHFSDPAELLEHCAAHLDERLVPRDIRFVTDWPTSASKIQKSRLYRLLAEDADTQTVRTPA